MKKKWIMPKASVDQFSTNEYLSACWGVACSIKNANKVDKKQHRPDIFHTDDHCGLASNQFLKDLNEDGTVDIMQEVGTDGLGTLECTLYTDATYGTERDIHNVEPTDYLYWTTSASDGRVWHHQGQAGYKDPSHPNRS